MYFSDTVRVVLGFCAFSGESETLTQTLVNPELIPGQFQEQMLI